MAENPHSRNLRKGRCSDSRQIYFLTKCIDCSSGICLHDESAKLVCNAILHRKREGIWNLLLFVVMPDHVHLLVALGEKKSLSRAMVDFAKFTATKINAILKRNGTVWQDGFYDHQVRRSVEQCPALMSYIHYNPVRKGLCGEPDQWAWSTAHANYSHEIETEWFW
jgi:putative transposase